MVTVTVQGTGAEVLKEMEVMCNLQSVNLSLPQKEAATPKAVKTSTHQSVAPATQAAQATVLPATPPPVATSVPATGPTAADIQKDVTLLAQHVGRDKALEVLATYGAKKGSEIQAKDFAAFHAEVTTIRATPKPV